MAVGVLIVCDMTASSVVICTTAAATTDPSTKTVDWTSSSHKPAAATDTI